MTQTHSIITQEYPIRIGTRGSPLALAQAYETRDKLKAAHNLSNKNFEIKIISTTGDQILDRPLSDIGGKGLFTKELEIALMNEDIDLAVHSMKDVATTLPDGLSISTILKREEVEDAFISFKANSIDKLPRGATVGTSSLRRAAQLKYRRPDIEIINFRGNVQTRLKKLQDNIADATFLAIAGLKRLKLKGVVPWYKISSDYMLPAVAQGAIGIEIRNNNQLIKELLEPLNHQKTFDEVGIERAFLRKLDGSCRTPIAALATLDEKSKNVNFEGRLFSLDGKECYKKSFVSNLKKAYDTARNMGSEIITECGGRNPLSL